MTLKGDERLAYLIYTSIINHRLSTIANRLNLISILTNRK